MKKIKLFFATDLHGSEKCFRKFIKAAKVYGADVMIIGGDLTGKTIIPFIVRKDGYIEADYFGQKLLIKSKNQEEKYIRNAADFGYYPYEVSQETYKDLIQNPKAINEVFLNLMKKRLEEWIKAAEIELKGINVIINAGNDDAMEIDAILDSSNSIIHPEGKVIEINGYEMISTGYANM
ncbi:MAG: hypothetical protein ACP5NC_07765, partial [Nitrososphaeria archaeon]